MQTHTAKGHLCLLTLLGESLSLMRLTRTGGWTQRVMPVSTVRRVVLTPPTLLRRGQLVLHLDGPSNEDHDLEIVQFERTQQQGVRELAAALEQAIPPSHAEQGVPEPH